MHVSVIRGRSVEVAEGCAPARCDAAGLARVRVVGEGPAGVPVDALPLVQVVRAGRPWIPGGASAACPLPGVGPGTGDRGAHRAGSSWADGSGAGCKRQRLSGGMGVFPGWGIPCGSHVAEWFER